MDLLGLDDLERHNWIRRWTDIAAPPPRTHLTYLSTQQMVNLRNPLRSAPEQIEELVRRGLLRERDVVLAKAMSMGVGFVELDRVNIGPETIDCVSRQVVTETGTIPVKKDGSTLWVALSDPKGISVLDRYKQETGCRIVPTLAVQSDIDQAISRYYPEGG